jgi:2-C-methyl-D-erythritol 4-phosphate cytidylyltransferase/2-C-methyl-D-erythritol 2,4-cyclodiphosphate synthase
LIAAAGRGERLGRLENKAFVELVGRPLVAHTLEALRACPEVEQVVLVVAPPDVERARRLLRPDARRGESVVPGGAARRQSVRAGLAEVAPASELVLVHDGARPFVTPQLVSRCLAAAARTGAAVAALPATDTIKEAGAEGMVLRTLDRSRLWLAQTPQAFRRQVLERAHEEAEAAAASTDDAALVERLGLPVEIVMGDPHNVKITSPADLEQAARFLQQGAREGGKEVEIRSGIGFDAHRFAEGRPLVLGGVQFPGERGLLGHSDADVVCHAICDAVLGAMAAGDIGQHFPDSDPRFAGISSLALLARVAAMAQATGWEVGNIDVVVIAEAPRLAPQVPQMRQAVAAAMAIAAERVSVKGKTTEGMGFTGRGEGIACHALCLLRRAPEAESPHP